MFPSEYYILRIESGSLFWPRRNKEKRVMKVTILCVGKVKEHYLADGIREYAKRLSAFCTLDLVEVPDEKTPDGAPAAEEDAIRRKEGQRILAKIPDRAFVITLEIGGEMADSVALSKKLQKLMTGGASHFVFVIGGSLGLSPEVRNRSDYALSFSRMTFPHQLMRLILLEQIYRCFKIMNHEPYHK